MKSLSENTVIGLSMLFEDVASGRLQFSAVDPSDQRSMRQMLREMVSSDQLTATDVEDLGTQFGQSKASAADVVRFFEDAGIKLQP